MSARIRRIPVEGLPFRVQPLQDWPPFRCPWFDLGLALRKLQERKLAATCQNAARPNNRPAESRPIRQTASVWRRSTTPSRLGRRRPVDLRSLPESDPGLDFETWAAKAFGTEAGSLHRSEFSTPQAGSDDTPRVSATFECNWRVPDPPSDSRPRSAWPQLRRAGPKIGCGEAWIPVDCPPSADSLSSAFPLACRLNRRFRWSSPSITRRTPSKN